MKYLICGSCKQKYIADEEGTDDEMYPICVGCITAFYHGTALTSNYSIQPVTLQEFRKRVKAMKSGKVKGRLRFRNA